jgi:hypothetical protein
MVYIDTPGDFYNLVVELRQKYRAAGMNFPLARRQHSGVSNPDYTRFSGIGLCSLKSAFDKIGVPAPIPTLAADENAYVQHVMDRGTYTQAMFQEPFLWYASQSLDFFAIAEPQITDEILKVNGNGDLIIGWRQDASLRRALVEIKDSEGANGKLGTPKRQYALQMIGYGETTGIDELYLIINSKRGFTVYRLMKELYNQYIDGQYVKSWGYAFYDRFGDLYEPDYGDDWNRPDELNYEVYKNEMLALREYQNKVREFNEELKKGLTTPALADYDITPPIQDPLNVRTLGWMCVAILDKGTKKRKPVARAACQYATHCHHLDGEKFEVEVDAVGNKMMPVDTSVLD